MHTKKLTAKTFPIILGLALLAGCASSSPETVTETVPSSEQQTESAAESAPAESEETTAEETSAAETQETEEASEPAEEAQFRGIWLAYDEYEKLGLTILEDEETYRKNADRFLEEAQKYGINNIFLQARAFDDAFWRSDSFRATHFLGADEDLTAAEAYKDFDPFGVFLQEAHEYGMKVHAWLNPYRVDKEYYYDPGDSASTERFLTAVRELLAYESGGESVDGIHIDDYFYHAPKGYFKIGNSSYKYAIVNSEEEKPEEGDYIIVSGSEKRSIVNDMVRQAYSLSHEKGRIFGISPAANYDNDMHDGVDIDTWLTEDGYLDYIIPQVYWSNQWGENADVTMYSDRLHQFLGLWKNNARFYVGLALYRTLPENANNDPGWQKKSTNLAEQIRELEEGGAQGYVFFSAHYLMEECAQEELANLR